MFNMLLDRLPISYKGYLIRTDYRIGIQISLALDDPDLSDNDRVWVALSLLYGAGRVYSGLSAVATIERLNPAVNA